MGLRERFRRRRPGQVRQADSADATHLREWTTQRRGVEGFVEPPTLTQPVTLLLVAHDGEWTRRRVVSVKWAHDFCNGLGVPSYDAALVGVPQRMRDHNARQRAQDKKPGFY